jgi:hypothetical protein
MIDNCFRKVNEEGIILEFCNVALPGTRPRLQRDSKLLDGMGR